MIAQNPGSRRQATARGYSQTLGINPYDGRLNVLDCGDVPVIPNDPAVAIDQVRAAYSSLLSRKVVSPERMRDLGYAKGLDGEYHPRMVTLGGDHTIVSVAIGRFRGTKFDLTRT